MEDHANSNLERLRRFDPLLKCVISTTEKTAMEQGARRLRHCCRSLPAGPYTAFLGGKEFLWWFPAIARRGAQNPTKIRFEKKKPPLSHASKKQEPFSSPSSRWSSGHG